jgi:CBS domain containing-hemolysin-like protein
MLADTWLKYPEQTGIIILLVVANAFFVATEFAFVKIRGSQLKSMRVKGKKDWRLGLAIRVTKHLDRYLSATQLGITLTSLALGWVGEPVVAKWLEKPIAHLDAATRILASLHISRDAAVTSISYAVAFAGITFIHIVLGELVPKYFAIQRPRTVVMWVGAPLVLFYHICYPFIWLLNRTANRLLMWMGIPQAKEFDHGFNQEELQYVLMNSRHVHPSDELVNKIMLKAIRLKETTAEQVMLPRDQIVVLWRNKTLAENMIVAQKSGYSRLPFCGDTLDQVLGVIHVKEMLWQHQVLGEHTNLSAIVRPILTFMAKTRLPAMLELFRRSRNHLALVLDSDEKLLGLVSFEDVLEELVGDIRDEFDIEKGPFFERSKEAVLVDADLPLRDLAVETGWPLTTQTTETVEKWAIRQWGHLPAQGAEIDVDGFHLVATEVNLRRIRRLRIIRQAKPQPTDADMDAGAPMEQEHHL